MFFLSPLGPSPGGCSAIVVGLKVASKQIAAKLTITVRLRTEVGRR